MKGANGRKQTKHTLHCMWLQSSDTALPLMIQEIQEIGKLVDLQNAPKRKHCKERVKLFFPLFEAYVTFKNKQKLVMINY